MNPGLNLRSKQNEQPIETGSYLIQRGVRRVQKNHRVKFAFVEYKSSKTKWVRGTIGLSCMRTNAKHETNNDRGSREYYGSDGRTNEREERGEVEEGNVYTRAPLPWDRCTKNGVVVVRGG